MRVSPEIMSLVPYKPGKPISETQREYGLTKVYKLASNENPLGISPRVKEAISKHTDDLFRYPDPSCFELTKVVSKLWNFPQAQIAVGNGSNEIIDLLIRIYCEPGDAVLSFDHSFVAYTVCAQAARARSLTVPVGPRFEMDLQKMALYLRENRKDEKIRIVFLPNPNNPTGVYIPAAEVQKFLQEFGNDPELLIVFDEAYNEFVRATDYRAAIDDVRAYKNVIAVRTLSKAYGLAGLRVGLLLASPDVIDLYNRVRNPFNVNELAQVAAVAALQDGEFVKKSVELTWQGLDYLSAELQNLGLDVIPSQGNFVLVDLKRSIPEVNEALLRRGVILRPVMNYGLKTYMRISVGLPEENQFAIKALKEVLGTSV